MIVLCSVVLISSRIAIDLVLPALGGSLYNDPCGRPSERRRRTSVLEVKVSHGCALQRRIWKPVGNITMADLPTRTLGCVTGCRCQDRPTL